MKVSPDVTFVRRADEARMVADLIRSDILHGYVSGKLPPEFELVSRYPSSRNAVRDALSQLTEQGLLQRTPRTGTSVVADGVVFAFDRTPGPIRIQQPNLAPATGVEAHRAISTLRRPAPATVARHLRLETGAPVVYLESTISVRDVPLRLRQSWVPEEYFPNALEEATVPHSLTQALETELGVELSTDRMMVEALNADPRTAELLGVRDGAAIFVLERLMMLPDGTPVEYGFSRHRGDRTIFEITVA